MPQLALSEPNEERPWELEELVSLLRENFEDYCGSCLKIRTKGADIVPLGLNQAQRIVHRALEEQKRKTGRVRAVILKARQEGISTYVAARFFHQAHLNPERSGLIIADLKKRSETLWDIYDRFDKMLPSALKWETPGRLRRQELRFASGSQIRVETAEDTAAGRAMTLQMVHASEVARFSNAEEVWTSLLQAVPLQGGEIIVESTAYGVGNFFHRLWEEAVSEGSWLPIFLPWWIHSEYRVEISDEERADIQATEHPWEARALTAGITFQGTLRRLDPEQIAWRRRIITDYFSGDERSFRQEYPSEPDEAFLAAGNQFFEEDLLERLRRAAVKPQRRGNLLRTASGIAFRGGSGGYLRIYEPPRYGNRFDLHYVIGADTASGRLVGPHADVASERGGRDFSCAEVIRLAFREGEEDPVWHPAKVVAELHGRMVPEVFASLVADLGSYYSCPAPGSRTLRNPALLGVERNHSSGETVIRRLQDRRYPNQYVRRRIARTVGRPTRELGWITDTESRRLMLDELAAAMRSGELEVPSEDLVRELRTFVLGEDGKPAATEGCHDDRIIAVAIATQMLRYHGTHGDMQPEEKAWSAR